MTLIRQGNSQLLSILIHNRNTISIWNLNLQYGDPSSVETEQIIVFVGCKQADIPTPFVCANESMRNQLFTQSNNAMIATTQVNQFNIVNKIQMFTLYRQRTLEEVGKAQILGIVDNSTYFSTTNLNIQESSVDMGFLLEQTEKFIYATDYYLTSQQIDQQYFRNTFQL